MGLDEFKSEAFKEHKKAFLIHKYMLPSIKPDSIQMRINNECKTKKNGKVKTTIGVSALLYFTIQTHSEFYMAKSRLYI